MSDETEEASQAAGLWRELADLVAGDPPLARYMQLSFDAFHLEGEWPNIERLQKKLLRDGDHTDLYAIAARIPSELGTDPLRVKYRCNLAVPAIALCAGAEEEVSDFLRVLKLAVDKYLSEEADGDEPLPLITSAELSKSLGLNGVALKRIREMTEWTPFLAGGVESPDGTWSRQVQPATRYFIQAETIDHYVDAYGAMRTPYRRSMLAPLRPEDAPVVGTVGPNLVGVRESEEPAPAARSRPTTMTPDRIQVFVVHGRNAPARDAMFAFLRAIGLQPIEWSQARALTGEASPYVGTILDAAFRAAQAIVVLLTPDEITYLRPDFAGDDDPETQPAAQARPNVLFEAGMAMGHDERRTVLVEFGQMRPFSDVVGRHSVRLDNTAAMRKELAQRLETAGCSVDLSGESWLTAGDFTPPPAPGRGLPLGRRVPQEATRRLAIDLRYHDRGQGQGRLEIVNRGTETVFNLDLVFPPEAANFEVMTQNELPLTKLPPGKSVALIALNVMGGGTRSHFDVKVTGQMEDGTTVAEEVFLSLR